jgi:enoyl-[acyl-carrier protein] reductase I
MVEISRERRARGLVGASGIGEFDQRPAKAQEKASARSYVSIDGVGIAAGFRATDAAKLITGETLYVDGGYHIID